MLSDALSECLDAILHYQTTMAMTYKPWKKEIDRVRRLILALLLELDTPPADNFTTPPGRG